MSSTSIACDEKGHSSATNPLGIDTFYGVKNSNNPVWPKEKATGGADGKGPQAVAANIVSHTNKDEKIKIAEHLAKSIEGGEVVEIRSVN